jgi:hypothetical protein
LVREFSDAGLVEIMRVELADYVANCLDRHRPHHALDIVRAYILVEKAGLGGSRMEQDRNRGRDAQAIRRKGIDHLVACLRSDFVVIDPVPRPFDAQTLGVDERRLGAGGQEPIQDADLSGMDNEEGEWK